MKRIALIGVVLLAGCGSGGGYGGSSSGKTSSNAGSTQPASSGAVAVKKTGIGSVVVDGSGRTLYMFGKDTGGKSSCTGACAQNWPPALAGGSPKAGSGVDKAKLTTTKRAGGQSQLVYAGHPLYRFSGDAAPGDTNGQGQNAFGGKWSAMSGSGAAATSSSSGGSSGGGSSGGGGGSYGGY